jgi:hypothetical protein
MKLHNLSCPNFLDKTNDSFKKLHNICDNLFRQLHSSGIGCDSKQSDIIMKDEENLSWTKGVMGLHSPKSLVRTVFFYIGKVFGLRGREEHRALKLSQFERLKDPDRYYVYTENESKNRNGGLGQLAVRNKVVSVFANDIKGDHCIVSILDFYISKLPSSTRQTDLFYVQPLSSVPANPSTPWFKNQPMGKNTLGNMAKAMFADEGRKTNHSLRATGVTEMFSAGVPEKKETWSS